MPVLLQSALPKVLIAVAARIREIATENKVPIFSDPPTSRLIHATVDIGAEIDPEQYRAIAVAIRFAEEMRTKSSYKHKYEVQPLMRSALEAIHKIKSAEVDAKALALDALKKREDAMTAMRDALTSELQRTDAITCSIAMIRASERWCRSQLVRAERIDTEIRGIHQQQEGAEDELRLALAERRAIERLVLSNH